MPLSVGPYQVIVWTEQLSLSADHLRAQAAMQTLQQLRYWPYLWGLFQPPITPHMPIPTVTRT